MSKMQHTFKWNAGKLNKTDLAKLQQFLEKLNREWELFKIEKINFAKKNETNTFIMPQVFATDTTNLNHQLLIGNNRLVMSYRQNNTAPWTNTQFIGFYGNNVRIQSGYIPQDPTDLTNKEFVEGLVRPFQQQIQQLTNQIQQMQQQILNIQNELTNCAKLNARNIFTDFTEFTGGVKLNEPYINGIMELQFGNIPVGYLAATKINEIILQNQNNGAAVKINNQSFIK